jgi:propionyl-CoA carboxylase alpha chain
MFYDPMIAKLITWGPTRDVAADLQIAALDAFEIEGLGHNIDFVSAIMQHPRFRSGELTTGFIAEEYPDGFTRRAGGRGLSRSLAAIAGFVATARADRARQVDGQLADNLPPPADWTVKLDGTCYRVQLDEDELTVDGEAVELSMEYTPGDRIVHAECGDEPLSVRIEPTRLGLKMTARGAAHKVTVLPTRIAHLDGYMIEKIPPDLSRFLICPMPGLLVSLHVARATRSRPGSRWPWSRR